MFMCPKCKKPLTDDKLKGEGKKDIKWECCGEEWVPDSFPYWRKKI